jgi:hypothetical protein
MSDLTIKRGDYGFYLQGTIQDSDGVAFNLTNYTVTLQIWQLGNWRYPIVEGTCEVTSSTEGRFRYTVGTSDFLVAGTYEAAARATKTGAQETTNTYTLEVKESP